MDRATCFAYLDTINDIDFTLLQEGNITGSKPAVRRDGLLRGFRVALIALHDRWALDQYLSSCFGIHQVIAFIVDDPEWQKSASTY